MREDFLHFVWKFQKFPFHNLNTTSGDALVVVHPGIANKHDGPDFLSAKIQIGDLLWVGAVEIHLSSADWYRHQHQNNPLYDNVILHVVWQDKLEVLAKNGKPLPTLCLENVVSPLLLEKHQRTFQNESHFIPCENYSNKFPKERWRIYTERLYFERLEQRTERIAELCQHKKNDWEAVLFVLLAKNFGLNVNGSAFLQVASELPFSVIRKLQSSAEDLEALFLGYSGLLHLGEKTIYGQKLLKQYAFFQHKFNLPKTTHFSFSFARLRPPNFPTLRWVQLAQLLASEKGLLSRFFSKNQLHTNWLFDLDVSPFWRTHYSFGKATKEHSKGLSKSFVELLKINTLIPFYYHYQKQQGNEVSELMLKWINACKAEENGIVNQYKKQGVELRSAMDTQGLLHLNKNYCQQKKCLFCSVGVYLLK